MIALDYSLSCPCMCLSAPSLPWATETHLTFHYLTSTKKCEGSFFDGLINGTRHAEWTKPEERYERISQFFIDTLTKYKVNNTVPVYIEDYSFGSKGKVFHIGENTGLMKYKLWRLGYTVNCVPPTIIKKFATGKGNAKKPDMYEAFKKIFTNIDLTVLGKPDGNPVSDIVDSYWLYKYGSWHDGRVK